MRDENLVVVGASHKSSTLSLREDLARQKPAQALELIRQNFNGELSELCVLATCNRYEVYAVGRPELGSKLKEFLISKLGASLQGDAHQGIYVLENSHAVSHLFSVSSGLESMVLGESEILGQVKDAYELALAQEYTKSVLNTAFQKALATGKKVRTETKISEGRLSVASVAVELAQKIFADFSNVAVAVVGAGAMGSETAKGLLHAKPKSQIFLSRTSARAQELANQYGGAAASLEALPLALESCDVVVTQLSADQPPLSAVMIEQAASRRKRPLFLLDIAMPRNIEEAASRIPNVYLYNIDDLKAIAETNHAKRKAEAESARRIVQEEVLKFLPRLIPLRN